MTYSIDLKPKRPRAYVIAFAVASAAVLILAVVVPLTAQAWDCRRYNFRVTSSGDVQAENRSGSDEPAQTADVFVNGNKVINNAQVPALKAGTSWTTFASVSVPSGNWTWEVEGDKDCGDDGEHEGEEPTKTPKPPTETPRPSHTPDPTATDTPTDIPTDTPEPSATPVTPTHTVVPSDTPVDTPTGTRPPPTNTRPPDPTDTPKPTNTRPPPTKEKTPEPTQTATPEVTTPTPSTPTITPTATPGCPCCCGYPEHISAWVDFEAETWIHLERVLQNSLPDVELHGPFIDTMETTVDLTPLVPVLAALEADLEAIRTMLVWIFIAILVSAGSLGLVYYGMNRRER